MKLNFFLKYHLKSIINFSKEKNPKYIPIIELLLTEEDSKIKKAYEMLNNLKDDNAPDIKTLLGICFEYGLGVNQDIKTARELFEAAAKVEYAPAQYFIGYCYFNGSIVFSGKRIFDALTGKLSLYDANKAYTLLEAAKKQGFLPAVYQIGQCYEHMVGVQQNFDKAKEWTAVAAELGDALAQERHAHNLSQREIAFEQPLSDEEREEVRIALLSSIDQGWPAAYHSLGSLYATNFFQDLQGSAKAIEILRLYTFAAAEGYSLVKWNLEGFYGHSIKNEFGLSLFEQMQFLEEGWKLGSISAGLSLAGIYEENPKELELTADVAKATALEIYQAIAKIENPDKPFDASNVQKAKVKVNALSPDKVFILDGPKDEKLADLVKAPHNPNEEAEEGDDKKSKCIVS